jgi:hypothetical protein
VIKPLRAERVLVGGCDSQEFEGRKLNGIEDSCLLVQS